MQQHRQTRNWIQAVRTHDAVLVMSDMNPVGLLHLKINWSIVVANILLLFWLCETCLCILCWWILSVPISLSFLYFMGFDGMDHPWEYYHHVGHKFIFFTNPKVYIMFIASSHWILTWATWIQSTASQLICWRSISSTLRNPKRLMPLKFTDKYFHLISRVPRSCYVFYPILLDFILIIIFYIFISLDVMHLKYFKYI